VRDPGVRRGSVHGAVQPRRNGVYERQAAGDLHRDWAVGRASRVPARLLWWGERGFEREWGLNW
jgi:hypothetical protein